MDPTTDMVPTGDQDQHYDPANTDDDQQGDPQQDSQQQQQAPQPAADPRYEALLEKFSRLEGTLETLTQFQQHQPQQQQQSQPDYDPGPLPENIETMSNQDVIQLMEQRMQKQLAGPLNDSLKQLADRFQAIQGQLQIQEARVKYDDWDEWLPEIKAAAKQNPTLNADHAYAVAVRSNPDKASKLAQKKQQAQPPKPPAGPPQAPPRGGGSTPSSAMDMNEAMQFAWNQNASGLTAALDSMDASY